MEKRGLGRGLSALIPETPTEADPALQEIPVDQIFANPYQPRTLFDPLKMEDLVASVREHGILQPILVQKIGAERFQLVAGERRFRAAQAAGMERIPAVIRAVTEQESLEIAIVENLQREDIGALESARAYRRLIDDFGLTQERVAKRVGKSRAAVANTLRLLNLPEAAQESLEQNRITEGHARALLMIESPAALLQALQTVIRRNLSVRDTERLAREVQHGSEMPLQESIATSGSGETTLRVLERPQRDPNEASVAERLQHRLGTKVTLRRYAGGSGRIEIDFFSDQELERVVEILLGESL